ncbi:MAG: hypothetical protein ACXAD7_09530 [Candidatus Kariarchaeaceae archaeon]|jgi:hypothetical protein
MSIDYDGAAQEITSEQISLLKQYYNDWQGDFTVNLKFRYVKVFGLDVQTKQTRWIILHRFVNKRRITNEKLPIFVRVLFQKSFIPIRLFQSVCEWLAPNEIYPIQTSKPHMLTSGIYPLENDDSLISSIECARKVNDHLTTKRHLVFSGNKSIHVWWLGFNYEDFIPEEWKKNVWKGTNRENLEQWARKRVFKKIQQHIPYKLDRRNAVDTRRVVPIISTINGFTGRKVVELNQQEILKLSHTDIIKKSQISGW